MKNITNKLVFLIIGFGVLLRLFSINQSLWLDEAIGAIAITKFSYQEIVSIFMLADNHPPLYYLTLKAWTSIFGNSELGLRSLSVVFGVGTIFLTFKIAEIINKSNNKHFPLLAVLLITFSQFHIYYSQEARMYMMAGFFATSAIYGILKAEKTTLGWLIFSFSLPLLLMSDFVPVFMIPVFFLYGVMVKKNRSWWKNYTLFHIPLMIIGFIYLPLFVTQIQNGRWLIATWPEWQSVAGGATVKQAILVWNKFTLGRISLINKPLYYSLIAGISVPFVIGIIKAFYTRKNINLIILWLFVPLLTGFVVSFIFPAFIYFRFVYVLPAFYLVGAWGLSHLPILWGRVLTLVILLFSLGSIFLYYTDPSQKREVWREAVQFIEVNAKPNEIVIFEFPEPFAPYLWYEKGNVFAFGATNSINANPAKTKERTESLISKSGGVYYFEYLHDLSDKEGSVVQKVEEMGFSVRNVVNFHGVGRVYYYNR